MKTESTKEKNNENETHKKRLAICVPGITWHSFGTVVDDEHDVFVCCCCCSCSAMFVYFFFVRNTQNKTWNFVSVFKTLDELWMKCEFAFLTKMNPNINSTKRSKRIKIWVKITQAFYFERRNKSLARLCFTKSKPWAKGKKKKKKEKWCSRRKLECFNTQQSSIEMFFVLGRMLLLFMFVAATGLIGRE